MRTQSQFLRLRRTKIGLRDFRTVKVIGKGAFGEVRISTLGYLQRSLLLRLSLPFCLIPPLASYWVSLFAQLSIQACPIRGAMCTP